jgi:hypothetical protein
MFDGNDFNLVGLEEIDETERTFQHFSQFGLTIFRKSSPFKRRNCESAGSS